MLQRAQSYDARAGTLSGDLTTLSEALGELDASLMEMRKRIRSVLGPAAVTPGEAPPGNRNGDG